MNERNWELYFALMETLGAEVLAMEFAKKMSREQMNDFLETTAREHDLNWEETE